MGDINTGPYYIQKRKKVDPIIQDDELWCHLDPECEFNSLELATRVASIIADFSSNNEFRIVRRSAHFGDLIQIPKY